MRTKILPTLIIALVLLLGSFFYVFYRTHQARIAEVQRTTAERAGDLVRAELQNHVALMSAALEPISRDPELHKALAANDREALLKRSAPLFDQLRGQFHVDHFYFHSTDRTNILRVHETDHFGDKIERITLKEAQRSGKPASGIEQGPTGNCTLRVVYPWRKDGQVIGYVELGTEFESVAQRVHDLLDVHLIAVVQKSLLDREKWEKRNKRLGRQTGWADFPEIVIIDRTLQEIPAPLREPLSKSLPDTGQTMIPSPGGGVLQVVFLPLNDVGGRRLGNLLVLADITQLRQQATRSVTFVATAFALVGGFLVLFFYVFLGKIEGQLNRHTQTLAQVNTTLEQRVRERAAELEVAHRKLVDSARWAGMAEVAVGVLHNVGNVLNSVNTSANVIAGTIRRSEVTSLGKACDMIRANRTGLGEFLTADERGKLLPQFLIDVAQCLGAEQQQVLRELESLSRGVDHIKQIVTAQQDLARGGSLLEPVAPAELIEAAINLQRGSFERHHVEMIRRIEDVPPVPLDKHKVIQILVNVVRNAKQAVVEAGRDDRKITLMLAKVCQNGREWLRFQVTDNGVGIAPENLTKIFAHGFTTREGGHGFGLHTAANNAREMDGSLTASSDGPGQGATFTLDLPFAAVANSGQVSHQEVASR